MTGLRFAILSELHSRQAVYSIIEIVVPIDREERVLGAILVASNVLTLSEHKTRCRNSRSSSVCWHVAAWTLWFPMLPVPYPVGFSFDCDPQDCQYLRSKSSRIEAIERSPWFPRYSKSPQCLRMTTSSYNPNACHHNFCTLGLPISIKGHSCCLLRDRHHLSINW